MRALQLLCGWGAISLILAGCGSGTSDSASTAAASSPGQAASVSAPATSQAQAAPPTISGTPASSVTAGSAYGFTPTASDPSGLALTFSASNLPSWATIDAKTGAIAGTPSSSAVGTFSNITITVSDGVLSSSLTPFSIVVNAAVQSTQPPATTGKATVTWIAPTANADGSPLTDLAGFTIYYGNNSASLTQSVTVSGASAVSYTLTNLSSGTWYFEVSAYTSSGVQSPPSAQASKTI